MAAGTDEAGVDTAETVAETWHVPSVRKAPRGWLVFSLETVLSMLRAIAAEAHLVRRAAVVHSNLEVTRNVPSFANIGGLPRGRQIGWRRDRCKSPALEGRDASAEEGNERDA